MANNNVIYLPAGVSAPAPAPSPVGVPAGYPFDRRFFESILPQSIGAFCAQTDCPIPRVELLTVDGVTHYVSGIIGVHDSWVALQIAKEEHRHPIQVFIPYASIFRVEVHPEHERRRHIGFITSTDEDGPKVIHEPAELAEAAAAAPAEPAEGATPAAGEPEQAIEVPAPAQAVKQPRRTTRKAEEEAKAPVAATVDEQVAAAKPAARKRFPKS